MVDVRLLAVLQVRRRQGEVCRGSTEQLPRTAAVKAILAAVGGSDGLGGDPQTPTVPSERTPSGAGSLVDSAAWDHWVVLTENRQREMR